MELMIGLISTGLIVVLVKVALSDWFFGLAKAKKIKAPIAEQDLYGVAAREQALRTRKTANREELKQWGDEFKKLVQNTCKHKYDMHASRWWVCTECKYEKPWYWSYECSCATYVMQSANGMYDEHILTHRSGVCNLHGRDFEQYKKEAAASFNKELESKIKMTKAMMDLQKYSKGGFTN